MTRCDHTMAVDALDRDELHPDDCVACPNCGGPIALPVDRLPAEIRVLVRFDRSSYRPGWLVDDESSPGSAIVRLVEEPHALLTVPADDVRPAGDPSRCSHDNEVGQCIWCDVDDELTNLGVV